MSEPDLEPGERELISGGFGGKVLWVWTVPLFGIAVLITLGIVLGLVRGAAGMADLGEALLYVCVFGTLGAIPYLLSGRWSLTDRRLVWRPRVGETQSIRLEEIPEDGVDAVALTSTLVVRTDDRRATLGFIDGLEQLWGGILLFRNPAFELPEPTDKDAGVECLVRRAWRVEGAAAQRGYLVIRRSYGAFLPVESAEDVITGLAESLGTSLSGAAVLQAEASPPFDVWLEVLQRLEPEEFDARLRQALRRIGEAAFHPEATSFEERTPFLRRNQRALWFETDSTSIRTPAIPRAEVEGADELLDNWRGSDAGPGD